MPSRRQPVMNKVFASLLAVTAIFFSNVTLAQKLKPGQAADIAQRQQGGKVLKVSPMNTPNKTDYRVKLLLPSGQITHIAIDGDSGRVLSGQGNTKAKKH